MNTATNIQPLYRYSILNETDIDFDLINDLNNLISQLTDRESAKIDESKIRKALFKNMSIVIVRWGTKIIGMGIISKVPRLTCDECEIHDVVVDASHRGKGIAKEIMAMLIEEGKKRFDAQRINLTSSPKREAANRLYQKLGFKLYETNYYRFMVEHH